MAGSLQFDVDTKAFRASVNRLGLKLEPTLMKGLRKGGNIIKKEVQKDYRGRVLRQGTGRLAKSVKVRRARTTRTTRGDVIGIVVQPRSFLARLHERGYTINPVLKNKKRAGERVGQSVRVMINGQWVTLKNRTKVPGHHVMERQTKRNTRRVTEAVVEFFKKLIREAGLG